MAGKTLPVSRENMARGWAMTDQNLAIPNRMPNRNSLGRMVELPLIDYYCRNRKTSWIQLNLAKKTGLRSLKFRPHPA